MDVIVLIGRILFSVAFVGAGVGHLQQPDAMAGYAESQGVPQPRVMVILTGIAQIAGVLALVLGVWPDLAALGLAIYVLTTAVVMHPFWKAPEDQQQQEQTQFIKDVSLGGAAIALFGFFAGVADLGLMLLGPALSL